MDSNNNVDDSSAQSTKSLSSDRLRSNFKTRARLPAIVDDPLIYQVQREMADEKVC